MKVTVHEEFQSFVIKPYSNFADGDCQALQEVLDKGVNSQGRHVLIDLKDLQNITAAGQRLLLSYSGQLDALRRSLILFEVNQHVMEALESSGLSNVIFIAPDLKKAKALALARK